MQAKNDADFATVNQHLENEQDSLQNHIADNTRAFFWDKIHRHRGIT